MQSLTTTRASLHCQFPDASAAAGDDDYRVTQYARHITVLIVDSAAYPASWQAVVR
jgi:hypothetical protein